MKAHVLTGTREEIVERLSHIDGDIREVVVVLNAPDPAYPPMTPEEDAAFLAEMDRQATDAMDVDYSRAAIYGQPAE